MGLQFSGQRVPHWKTVAKRKARVQAIVIPIMAQQATTNRRDRLKSRFQRKRSDSLIKPKTIFSVIWKAYLYFCATISRGVVTGKPSTTGEWPVIAPSIVAPRNIPFRISTNT